MVWLKFPSCFASHTEINLHCANFVVSACFDLTHLDTDRSRVSARTTKNQTHVVSFCGQRAKLSTGLQQRHLATEEV